MKHAILISIFLFSMVLGGMMEYFENPLGDYVMLASVIFGIYLMEKNS